MVALHYRNHCRAHIFALSLEPFFQCRCANSSFFSCRVIRKHPRETTKTLFRLLSLSVRHVYLGQTRRPFRQARQYRVQSALDAKRTKETKSKTRRVADDIDARWKTDKDARRPVAKNSVSLEISSTAICSFRGDQIERV